MTTLAPLLYLHEGLAFYRGTLQMVNLHRHHAVELVVSELPSQFWNDSDRLLEGRAALLGADVMHQFVGAGWQWFIYVEPESPLGVKLTHLLSGRLAVGLPDTWLVDLPVAEATTAAELKQVFDQFIQRLLPNTAQSTAPRLDDRIRRTLAYIPNHLDAALPLNQLLDVTCLSEGRLRHLFKEQIGIPVRKYILWSRMQVTIQHVLRGQNLTQAAHSGGFADSAHFSRTFSEMFGICPSDVLLQ